MKNWVEVLYKKGENSIPVDEARRFIAELLEQQRREFQADLIRLVRHHPYNTNILSELSKKYEDKN